MKQQNIRTDYGAKAHVKSNGTGTINDPFVLVRDVNVQDQSTPVLIVPFHNTAVTTTLTAPLAIDDKVISVDDATGIVAGQFLTAYNIEDGRYYHGRVTGVAVNDISVDTPLDFAYQVGDSLSTGSTKMNVNGSVTPQKFTIRAPDPGIPMVGDITRLIFILETTGDTPWGGFGDLSALTNGVTLRRIDGSVHNIFNIKSNAEMAAIMFDLDRIDRTAPQGTFGLKGRLTFGGQNKIGVVLRLDIDEDLEIIIQDDLSGLVDFRVVAEGHVVV